MQTFDDISAARDAIADYPRNQLPEALRDRFKTLRSSPSPVDQIVGLGEFFYANRQEIDDDATELAGGLIAFATLNAWHGLIEDNRGNRIVQAIRRDLGEEAPAGMEWPAADTDPAPLSQYVQPVAPAPAE